MQAGTYGCGVLILTVIQGPDKGRKFERPDPEPQLIGRSSEALPIDDNAVSRRHAELTPDDGAWYIRDLDSQNGTYLNGVKLSARPRAAKTAPPPTAANSPTAPASAPAIKSAPARPSSSSARPSPATSTSSE